MTNFKIYQQMATKSPCYAAKRAMKPTGIVVHSTGANNPWLKRYVGPDDGILGENIYKNYVNREDHRVIAHAYIGKDKNGEIKCYQTLPFDIACWSAGSGSKGSYNYDPQGRIQFEVCEDGLKDAKYFNAVFDCAADFCAYICDLYGFGVDKICSHKEGHKAGYASNHGDPENWFVYHNKTMDWFRSEVQKKLDAIKAEKNKKEEISTIIPEQKDNVIYKIQAGAFSNAEKAATHVDNLKKAGFSAFIIEESTEKKEEEKKEIILEAGSVIKFADDVKIIVDPTKKIISANK
jgi:hypothetical protein